MILDKVLNDGGATTELLHFLTESVGDPILCAVYACLDLLA